MRNSKSPKAKCAFVLEPTGCRHEWSYNPQSERKECANCGMLLRPTMKEWRRLEAEAELN